MSYALVQNDLIVNPGPMPPVWNDGQRDWDMRALSDEELAVLGWFPIVYLDRPPNTPTTTWDSSLMVVDGVPTYVWTERPWTDAELARDEASQNSSQIRAESAEAVDALIAVVERLNTLTAAQTNPPIVREIAALLRTVTRQVIRNARIDTGRTDDAFTGATVWIQPRQENQ
jgi:hypothetical protein